MELQVEMMPDERDTFKVSSDGSTLVTDTLHWSPIDEDTPVGIKMLLINKNHGVAVVSNFTRNSHFTHYAALPKFRKS